MGAIHGAVQIFEKMLGIKKCVMPCRREDAASVSKGTGAKRWAIWLLRMLLLFAIVCLAWVFFRAQSFSEAMYVLAHMFDGIVSGAGYFKAGFVGMGMGIWDFAITVAFYLLPLTVYDFLSSKHGREYSEVIAEKRWWVRWLVYVVIVLLVVFLSPKGTPAEFVYFQF